MKLLKISDPKFILQKLFFFPDNSTNIEKDFREIRLVHPMSNPLTYAKTVIYVRTIEVGSSTFFFRVA